jgi:acetylglutamate kinase
MPRDVSTLLEALPYIRQFHGQTIVIKYGGAAMVEDSLRESFARDVVLLKYVGLHPVIVHGGGNEISEHMGKLGLDVEFVDGLRVTDQDTVDVAKMVLVGKVNKDIVQRINRHGQLAVGVSGDDGGLFRVSKTKPGGKDIGFVGKVDFVNTGLLDHIQNDYISVIASVGSDRDGQSYNINADEAAGAVAHALGASKTIFLTDVAGWLKDPSDPTTLISQTTTDEVEKALPTIDGGMKPKLQACIDAIRGGGNSASIVDGREPHSILLELFTDEGFGTQIKPER